MRSARAPRNMEGGRCCSAWLPSLVARTDEKSQSEEEQADLATKVGIRMNRLGPVARTREAHLPALPTDGPRSMC